MLFLAGCTRYHVGPPQTAVLHPFAPIPKTFARVCVIRPNVIGFALAAPTWDDDTLVGTARAKTYFCYEAEPGAHQLRVEIASDKTERAYEAAPGESLYFLVKLPMFGSVELRQVERERAIQLMDNLDPVVMTSAPESEHLPPPIPFASAR